MNYAGVSIFYLTEWKHLHTNKNAGVVEIGLQLSQTGPLYDINKFCLIKKAFRFSFTYKQAAENLDKKEVNW